MLTSKRWLKMGLLLFVYLPGFVNVYAQDTLNAKQYRFDLTVLDLPYQYYAAKTVNQKANLPGFIKGYANPSMNASLSLSGSMYTSAHYGIKELFKTSSKKGFINKAKKIAYPVAVFYSDQLLMYLPGGDGWLHEEFHRAVMTRRYVNSFNGMNRVPLGAEEVSVSHISDENLIRFKKEDPAGFVRMQEAGIEGEYLLIDQLQRNNFFSGQKLLHEIHYLFSTVNSIFYVRESSNPETVDVETDKMNQKEITIRQRDFTGFDFSGWVYDLFRPTESYEQRGVHPTGSGINRYRKTTHLTGEEIAYLKKQGNLQLLNLFSPMLYGFREIKLGKELKGNFALRHILTSFGDDIVTSIFLKSSRYHTVFSYHHFQNKSHFFPGLQAELLEHPTSCSGKTYLVSYKLFAGLQPVSQSFTASRATFLGLAALKVQSPGFYRIRPYFEVEAKTRGWVAGNAFLTPNISIRGGLSYAVHRN